MSASDDESKVDWSKCHVIGIRNLESGLMSEAPFDWTAADTISCRANRYDFQVSDGILCVYDDKDPDDLIDMNLEKPFVLATNSRIYSFCTPAEGWSYELKQNPTRLVFRPTERGKSLYGEVDIKVPGGDVPIPIELSMITFIPQTDRKRMELPVPSALEDSNVEIRGRGPLITRWIIQDDKHPENEAWDWIKTQLITTTKGETGDTGSKFAR